MYIEELKGGEELGDVEEEKLSAAEVEGGRISIVGSDTKRFLVGAGARVLFYPTLLYNVVRNKVQAEFRWWDWVDEFVLLGAIPFPSDVKRLSELGVCGVITLNEPYETLVPTSLYQAYGIDHLVLPTRDFLFAPSMNDINQAVEFIHENALSGRSTYVHCKAGRGRSTTIVLCYLVQYKRMMPDAAYSYVKSIRPRVLLASSQWQAVQDYYYLKVKKMGNLSQVKTCGLSQMTGLMLKNPEIFAAWNLFAIDDGSVVVVTEADLDGYDPREESGAARSDIWADPSLVYRVRVAGQAALGRLTCLWFRCHNLQRISSDKSIRADNMGGLSVDVHVY